MLKVAALGLSALLSLGCVMETVSLTEKDLEDIRRDIRKTYAEQDARDCEDYRVPPRYTWEALQSCREEPFRLIDLFLELKDGEASGFIKYETRADSREVSLWCSVTVYDNGSYVWKCER